ncbi:hypothetical protein HYU89_04515 [Candidatus Collierbacteria bacterium]|nr:hypothetical protein [Candidatus Collierbacteria bacterium]
MDLIQSSLADQQTKLSPQSSVSSGHPEINPGTEPAVEQKADIEVIPESPEISPELAEHVEKVVRGEIQLPGPIEVGKHKGENVTISPFTPQQPNIVLPVTQSDFQQGAKQPTSAAWRWLYEWVRRVILMAPGRTLYRQ